AQRAHGGYPSRSRTGTGSYRNSPKLGELTHGGARTLHPAIVSMTLGPVLGCVGSTGLAHGQPHREGLALRCLGLAGYTTYFPRLRQQRRSHGRRIELQPPLFPGYAFVSIELQWHTARWAIGVVGPIMDGGAPARVPDSVIAEIRSRERNGLVELPKLTLEPGARVRVLQGPLQDHIGLLGALRPH